MNLIDRLGGRFSIHLTTTMSAQVMSVHAVNGKPTMMVLHHEKLSASLDASSLLAMLARQKEKALEAVREWQDIKAHLASAYRQQDDILQANAIFLQQRGV